MKRLLAWLDQRTGCKKIAHEALYENVPGGSRWRYVWGSTLTFTLVVQIITGIFLWMSYAPSSTSAWESVYFIQHEMWFGWLLRGIHHFTAHAMNVLLVLHLMQVVIDGAYKAPREINFWFGMVLLLLVLGLSLTGYLLPWDQKGYWATKVATSIAAIVPVVGPEVQKLIIGGTEYGHHTLTRFFALHAGVLPGAILVLLVGHIYLFRRHGLTAKEPRRKPDAAFWPDQVLKDAVACLAVLAAVLLLALKNHGAELTAPADPADNYAAARPEWYFMFLFQLLKYFPGQSEIIGAMILPGLFMTLVFLMPYFGKWRLGHRFNLGLMWGLLFAIGLLTWRAFVADRNNPGYVAAVKQADRDAERVVELARSPMGIPSGGAVTLLRDDPLTQGPKLFAKHCASCHRYDGLNGFGARVTTRIKVQTNDTFQSIAQTNGMTEAELRSLNQPTLVRLVVGQSLEVFAAPAASDLKGFASREWLAGLINPSNISSSHYFGPTKFADGKMAKFVKKDVAAFSDSQQQQLAKVIDAVSAEAQLKSQRAADERDAAVIGEGRTLFASESMRCAECHQFRKKDEDATAPDLTGYGSREWLAGIISNPKHERFYGKRNDRMPAFGPDMILDAHAIGLVADWLRGEWYELAKARATDSR
ncbi:MAG: ubiquinol-cytochrome c reductase cytochrome b subunit [Verrucomicrobiota bacterium]|jgi:ubiquinol-cytochrome c reductase cytochrome b subunit